MVVVEGEGKVDRQQQQIQHKQCNDKYDDEEYSEPNKVDDHCLKEWGIFTTGFTNMLYSRILDCYII